MASPSGLSLTPSTQSLIYKNASNFIEPQPQNKSKLSPVSLAFSIPEILDTIFKYSVTPYITSLTTQQICSFRLINKDSNKTVIDVLNSKISEKSNRGIWVREIGNNFYKDNQKFWSLKLHKIAEQKGIDAENFINSVRALIEKASYISIHGMSPSLQLVVLNALLEKNDIKYLSLSLDNMANEGKIRGASGVISKDDLIKKINKITLNNINLNKFGSLSIAGNGLTPTDINKLFEGKRWPNINIDKLILIKNKIGNKKIDILSETIKSLSINILNFSSNDIGSSGIKILISKFSEWSDGIKSLDISSNRISEQELIDLASKLAHSSLTEIKAAGLLLSAGKIETKYKNKYGAEVTIDTAKEPKVRNETIFEIDEHGQLIYNAPSQ